MMTSADYSSICHVILDEQVSFDTKVMELYRYQIAHNPTYRSFVSLVKYNEYNPQTVKDIPFFPIGLFKQMNIKAGDWEEELTFLSSGTTAASRSEHHVRDLSWYLANTRHIWSKHFDPVEKYAFISLLPSYHANTSSSLLYMVKDFMLKGQKAEESYFIDDHQALYQELERLDQLGVKTVLFGVSFALLDYVAKYTHTFVNVPLIIETGGMKKHRREITRAELHTELERGFGGAQIISEYGMTECLSQMYCLDSRYFVPNDRMKIIIMDPSDPGCILPQGRRGRICIIDLANIDTMPFIATDDLGVLTDQGVEILGRIDASDLRGCNYLVD